MISVAPTITDAGKDLLFRAVSGEAITFTRFKIGNGNLVNSEIAPLTDLINPLVEFPIVESDASEKGYVKITGKFDNTYIKDEFQWRELGLFCKGEDGVEVLYAYSNDGENAGVLKVQTSDVVAEQTVALVIAIGDAPNVTAILSDLVLYTPKEEFDEHVNAKNPHGLDAEAVGLGKVPNVSTNDQTPTYTIPTEVSELKSGEKLGIAFGKMAKAISSLIAHLKDKSNPHGLSAESLGAAESKHEHSAADINKGVLSILRGGTGATTAEQALEYLGAVKKTGDTMTGHLTLQQKNYIIVNDLDKSAMVLESKRGDTEQGASMQVWNDKDDYRTRRMVSIFSSGSAKHADPKNALRFYGTLLNNAGNIGLEFDYNIYHEGNLPNPAQIEIVKYTGTGSSDNQWTLSFSKDPKLIIIVGTYQNLAGETMWGIGSIQSHMTAYSGSVINHISLTTDGNGNITFKQITPNSSPSLNSSVIEYTCYAFM